MSSRPAFCRQLWLISCTVQFVGRTDEKPFFLRYSFASPAVTGNLSSARTRSRRGNSSSFRQRERLYRERQSRDASFNFSHADGFCLKKIFRRPAFFLVERSAQSRRTGGTDDCLFRFSASRKSLLHQRRAPQYTSGRFAVKLHRI